MQYIISLKYKEMQLQKKSRPKPTGKMPNSGHLGITTGKAPRAIIDSSQKSEHNPEQGKIIGNIN